MGVVLLLGRSPDDLRCGIRSHYDGRTWLVAQTPDWANRGAPDLISFQAAALFEGRDNPLRRLLEQPDEDDGRAARNLLASALAAVEAVEGT